MLGEIVTGVVLGLLVVLNAGQYLHYTAQRQTGKQNYNELMNRLLASENEKRMASDNLEFLKASIIEMLKRPVLATMTDTQVSQMVDTILSYTQAQKNPARLN